MDRREWLTACAAGLPFSPAFALESQRISIKELEVFRVKVNLRGDWVLFRLSTNEGLTGIGDASHGGRDDQTVSIARTLMEGLKGRSIFDVEWLRRSALTEVERSRRPAAVALGGLEQCLWDLQGKALGVPVYQLFGGMLHPRIRNYANINRSVEVRGPAGFAAMAERAVAAGFDAVKLAPFDGMPSMDAAPDRIANATELAINCAEAVRKAIGPNGDLLIDVHSHMNLERGLDLARRMEPLNLFWLEEVCRSHQDLAAINKAAKMPTAGGESIFGVRGFFPYLAAGAVDIAMPDIKYCGGMLELKKISAMAEGAGLTISPHGPASPVGNMAAAHVCATLQNFLILEHAFGEVPWRAELIDPPETLEKGRMTIPDRAGFGIALNHKTIQRYSA